MGPGCTRANFMEPTDIQTYDNGDHLCHSEQAGCYRAAELAENLSSPQPFTAEIGTGSVAADLKSSVDAWIGRQEVDGGC